MYYQIPVLFLGILFLVILKQNKHDLLCPQNVVCGLYCAMAVSSIFLVDEYGSSFTKATILPSILGFSLMLVVTLLPCFVIRKPKQNVNYRSEFKCMHSKSGQVVLLVLACLGIYGFSYLLPPAIKSLSLSAFVARELQESNLLVSSPYLTVAAIPATFFALYGLILFSPVRKQCGVFVKIGLAAGFGSYALNNMCNKGRDWLIQYLLILILYYWLFGTEWSRRFKRVIILMSGSLLLFGLLLVAQSTVERFGLEGTGVGIAQGTIGYLGQQVYMFVETVEMEDFTSEWPKVMFPLAYKLVGEEPVEVKEYLGKRTMLHQYSFGTFLATLYPVVGWNGLIIFAVCFLGVFWTGFLGLYRREKYIAYSILLLLYFQFMTQGVFYWMMYGRSGNVYALGMACVIVALAVRKRKNLKYSGMSSMNDAEMEKTGCKLKPAG
ncbi:MAG TPA: hypothetical protein P5186_11355 [Candidatus Paceibacterota bacterium]|nr:hypothetical protein [Candidatus Paceibacterota bacterium]